jgi:hypothetical protein
VENIGLAQDPHIWDTITMTSTRQKLTLFLTYMSQETTTRCFLFFTHVSQRKYNNKKTYQIGSSQSTQDLSEVNGETAAPHALWEVTAVYLLFLKML